MIFLQKLQAAKECAGKATQGEWKHEIERYSAKHVIGMKPIDDRWIAHCQPEFNGFSNAQHITTMNPSFTLELIEKFERMRKALEFYADSSDNSGNPNGLYAGYAIEEACGWDDPVGRFCDDEGSRAREALLSLNEK